MAIENATQTPQPLNPSDDAKQDFERVSQALHDGGARDAYNVLKEEMDKTKDLSPQERNEWQKEMTAQLTQAHNGADPILPRISLAYLEANKASFNTYGSVDTGKIEQRKAMNDLGLQVEELAPDGRDAVNNVEAALLSGLGEVKDETVRAGMTGDRSLSFTNVRRMLDADQEAAKNASSIEVSDRKEDVVASQLLANDGALFKMVDSQFGSQTEDGKVTDREIRDLLNTLEKNPLIKSRFSAEELTALENLKGVLNDKNNTDHGERQGSVVKHDSLGQFFRNFSFDTAAADRYFVTRESLASGATADATVGVGVGAVVGGIGAGLARVGAEAVENAGGEGDGRGPNNVEGAPSNAEGTTDNPNPVPVQAADDSSNGTTAENTTARDEAMPVEEEHLAQPGENYERNIIAPPESLTELRSIVYNADSVDAPVDELVRINAGDSYWRTARRLVNYAGGDLSNARVAQLTQALQEANGNKLLHPDQNLYELLKNERVSSILNPQY